MSNKHKKTIARLSIGAIFFIATFFIDKFNLSFYPVLILNLIPYFIIGGDVLLRAIRNIFRGQVFDENFLMAIATVGAIVLGEYTEAVAVMLFYQVGELFQSYAVGKSRNSIAEMMDIRPDYANLKTENDIEKLSPEKIKIGDIIVIKPGERVPLDAVITSGSSQLDVMALTGESVPINVSENSEILSGSVNISGVIEARVTKLYTESTVSRILELVENATEKKARSEQFITRFARYYTPVVVISSVLLAVIPPLVLSQPFSIWISRALIFLVVSCPCALVISVPLSFFGGIGGASRKGVLIKGSNYLEALATTDTVVFDKTGTLTNGFFSVSAVHPEKMDEEKLLEYTAYAESYSNHPLAISIKEKYGKQINLERIQNTEEIAGKGIEAIVDGKKVCAGNAKLMEYCGAKYHECELSGTIIHVAIDGEYEGHIVISDQIKEDSKHAIFELKKLGVKKTVMLTGDKKSVAEEIANKLSLDEVHSELLPQDKVTIMEELLEKKYDKSSKLAFVGDGINDAPVLARADVGIAMGALGSDAAIEAADIVLMDDKPSSIAIAVKIARKTLSIVRQNIIFAIGVKFLVLILAAFGLANMWLAVFADVGVAVIAILNAMRAMKL